MAEIAVRFRSLSTGRRLCRLMILAALAILQAACNGSVPQTSPPRAQTSTVVPASADSRATIVAAQSTIEFARTVEAKQATVAAQPREMEPATDTPTPKQPTPTPSASPTPLTPTPTPTPIPRSPLSGKIVFLSDRLHRDRKLGDVDLFVMNPDGSDLKQIQTDRSFPFFGSVVVSPDNTTIAVGAVNGAPEEKGIYFLSPEGEHLEFVSAGGQGIIVHSWAENNQILVSIYAGHSTDLFTYDVDRKEFRRLTEDGDAPNQYAAQSPDGEKIAFAHYPENSLWLMGANGDNRHPLIDMGGLGWMAWSPDGKYIAFDQGYDDIFVVDVVSRDVRNITNTSDDTLDGFPSWSPDGKRIAFIRAVSQFDSRITVVDLVTGKTNELTGGVSDYDPFWVR